MRLTLCDVQQAIHLCSEGVIIISCFLGQEGVVGKLIFSAGGEGMGPKVLGGRCQHIFWTVFTKVRRKASKLSCTVSLGRKH